MSIWRLFVCWLARDEIKLAIAEIARVHAERGFEMAQARAESFIAGRKAMVDEIEQIVNERSLGMGDYVNADDVAKARKVVLH